MRKFFAEFFFFKKMSRKFSISSKRRKKTPQTEKGFSHQMLKCGVKPSTFNPFQLFVRPRGQNSSRGVRSTLSEGTLARDWDAKNCHPTVLLRLRRGGNFCWSRGNLYWSGAQPRREATHERPARAGGKDKTRQRPQTPGIDPRNETSSGQS
jgi:hypothetical protein